MEDQEQQILKKIKKKREKNVPISNILDKTKLDPTELEEALV